MNDNYEAVKRYRAKHPERYKESYDKVNSRHYKRRVDNGLCRKCNEPVSPGFVHCEKHKEQGREYWRRFRQQVLDHYGRSCACCGESTEEFLSVDHINGGGNQHRKELGRPRNGSAFYRWLVRNGYPEGYQILCHNCNFAKGHYGVCPHGRMRQSL